MSTKNERRSEFRHATERAALELAVRGPRNPHDDITGHGLGHRVLQLCSFPSFDRTVVFDVREQAGDSLRAYRADSPSAYDRLVTGYRELPADAPTLAAFVSRARALQLPLLAATARVVTLDGTRVELACFAAQNHLRLAWIDECAPTEWGAAQQLFRDIFAALSDDSE